LSCNYNLINKNTRKSLNNFEQIVTKMLQILFVRIGKKHYLYAEKN